MSVKKKVAGAALKYAAKKGAANAKAKTKRIAARIETAVAKVLENPGYMAHGADEDLFGGPSRKLPKKAKEFSRPRVKIRGSVVTFAKHSPFKGRVEMANPSARILVAPLRVILDRAEVNDFLDGGRWPSSALVSKILAQANKRAGWDHIEAVDAKGRHLFDLLP